ncbi:hypothetical protein ACFSQP_04320 [Bizionia sediminis]|uniref:STAS/SEC14 domain-containing protein n=1 Tax=Bizionia sediminis TaxID=1737064 RepID=A0ABW5KTD8_9FLAO
MAIVKKYSVGEITLYDTHMIAVMNEGITVKTDLYADLLEIVQEHYSNKKFVYITHRVNSYAVDPGIYLKMSKIDNLLGFAVVYGNTIKFDNTDFEQSFISVPFKTFKTLHAAKTWAKTLCKDA